MAEMFGLLKELTASRTPKKVLMREESRHPITKNVNSISLLRIEEEENRENNRQIDKSIMDPGKSDEEKPPEVIDMKNEVERKADDETAKSARENVTKNEEYEPAGVSSSHVVRYYPKHRINEKLIEGLVENQKFNDSLHSYIYPLGIAEDVLMDVAGYVYPLDFMILDIREDEKRPFILGTPFLTTAKAVIKFVKGTITLRSGKSKISFHRTPEPNCRIEKRIENDIEPIAPTMTVNRLVPEWEEKIKLHQEKEMKFNQWRSKIFNNEHPASVKEECEMEDEGGVT
ncbi:zinc finger, CCHC-type containing protein [Tanacetum coccineum]